MSHLLDPVLLRILEYDRDRLAHTKFPIITLSGAFQEDLVRSFAPWPTVPVKTDVLSSVGTHQPAASAMTDVVFSRAHFSMAIGIAVQAWGKSIQPKEAWAADPTNYVSQRQWRKIQLTENIGKTLARQPIFKYIKDFIDQFGRTKLPIIESITPPLLHLTEDITQPIISVHIAVGNVLAEQGRKVVQVVTDPHVRPEYVKNAHLPTTRYCVFDDRTKMEFLEVAALQKQKVHPDHVIVTGPPVDPRVVNARKKKTAWRSGALNLCVTTGGLGTNKAEIKSVLEQLLPQLRRHPSPFKLLIYAGTQKDIAEMVRSLARSERVHLAGPEDTHADLRLIYHPHILEANELLIQYGFPWADGFITKPSGDMAYDAVAAGCFLLTLQEWGVWEERIREVFEQKEVARRAEVDDIVAQLELLKKTIHGHSWVEDAMNTSLSIEKLFLHGNAEILKVARNFATQP